jgi:hypothetical protein
MLDGDAGGVSVRLGLSPFLDVVTEADGTRGGV